jgi:MFS family permease
MATVEATPKPVTEAGILVTWRELPRAAKAVFAGLVVNRLGSFIQVFLVLFLTDRGFTTGQAGVALGVYGAGTVAGVLLGGELTDRLGPRRTILLSMVSTAGFVVLYLGYYPALLVAVAIVGAISQAYRPASSMLMSQLTPKARLTMMVAMYRLAFNLGSAIAPPSAPAAVHQAD